MNQSRYSFGKKTIDERVMQAVAPVPFGRLWSEDIAVIEDQLYTDRALTEPMYRQALEYVLEEKQNEMRSQGLGAITEMSNVDAGVLHMQRTMATGKKRKAKAPPDSRR